MNPAAASTAGRAAVRPNVDFDPARVRADFPILQTRVNGKPLAYLDNAATSQKPLAVLEAIQRYYRSQNANIHRGVHFLSEQATDAYENARRRLQRFVNAAESAEMVFVRGTTEAINLVAQTFGRSRLRSGDEIVVTAMEHHSNIVPWQLVCEATGARLVVLGLDSSGALDVSSLEGLFSPRTRLIAVTHVSNALGTINPVREIAALAHSKGVPVLVDGAQAVPHQPVDVQEIGCDFYAFSGHKMYGPTGIGVLYGRRDLLESLPPYQGGGDMIRSVSFEGTQYAAPPSRFEAGTPNIEGAIGLAAAVDYLESIGWEAIGAQESRLLSIATEALAAIPGVRIWGNAVEKAAVVSFTIDGIHPHDIGTIADQEGMALRAGHHCAQPLMDLLKIPATARASFAFYNTDDEARLLGRVARRAVEIFGR